MSTEKTETTTETVETTPKPETETATVATTDSRLADDHPAAIALKNANKEAADLRKKVKEFEDAGRSELEKATNRAAEAEKRAAAAELSALRVKVALATGVPAGQAHRLQGKTEAEMTADAKSMLEELPVKKSTSFDGGAGKSSPTGGMNDLIAASRRK